jgi:DNA-binding transcriptional MocR family regulator
MGARLAGRSVLIYLAIADALGADLHAGRLPTGGRLPSQRALAKALGIDLTTVTRALPLQAARALASISVDAAALVMSEAASSTASSRDNRIAAPVPSRTSMRVIFSRITPEMGRSNLTIDTEDVGRSGRPENRAIAPPELALLAIVAGFQFSPA